MDIYTYIFIIVVCLMVCMSQINDKAIEPIESGQERYTAKGGKEDAKRWGKGGNKEEKRGKRGV